MADRCIACAQVTPSRTRVSFATGANLRQRAENEDYREGAARL